MLRCNISNPARLFCRSLWPAPRFLKQPVSARSNSALPCNSASRQVVDRQKLTSIWSRFELNIALPRFLQISVTFPARLLEVISALKADFCRGGQTMEAVGRCGLEIVSRGLTRVTSHGADLVSGALLQISHQTLHLIRIDCGFLRATDLPAWNPRLSHPEKRPQACYCGAMR
jgi:hypothetical protein